MRNLEQRINDVARGIQDVDRRNAKYDGAHPWRQVAAKYFSGFVKTNYVNLDEVSFYNDSVYANPWEVVQKQLPKIETGSKEHMDKLIERAVPAGAMAEDIKNFLGKMSPMTILPEKFDVYAFRDESSAAPNISLAVVCRGNETDPLRIFDFSEDEFMTELEDIDRALLQALPGAVREAQHERVAIMDSSYFLPPNPGI